MQTISLGGGWTLTISPEQSPIDVLVPGSVYHDLLQAGQIEDPFYRDREEHAKEVMRQDYIYSRTFDISHELYQLDRLELVCEGLDTLSSIYVNGQAIAETNNMHRTYIFDVKGYLQPGTNEISIKFKNTLDYIEDKQSKTFLWAPEISVSGFPHIRKAHYSYGWDWGPQLPDAGIWRDIYIRGYEQARLTDVYMTQHHQKGLVTLDIKTESELWGEAPFELKALLTSPDGQVLTAKASIIQNSNTLQLQIENPELWWPNGYGDQPLYQLQVLLQAEGKLLDERNYTIGLRTLRVKQEPDEWGTSFAFEVNGVAIFAMGANYIPEDNLLPRTSAAKTEQLIKDCIEANFNCIRVWGGGFYPGNDFYDLCDRYGLIVWQDFMFACAVYELTDEFAENIRQEAIDNMLRLRHHASLGLWCGNNEMEMAWETWDFPKDEKLRQDYLQQFEVLLAKTAAEYDPNTFYWASSPSSGGGFDDPNDQNRGDVHYWDVWHGLKPFTDYRHFHFRFCSEFGFQSFPSMKTIETYTLPEDRNIFSYVMERHQKNDGANGKILYYLAQNFKYPKDLASLVYASQLLQAEAMKYGVEHWRRHRGRCMGSIYWQLNDCWPVASWSSIDYYGRWKALHYFAKRFYAPVLLSACDEGAKVELHVSNETLHSVSGTVSWKLWSTKDGLLREGSSAAEIAELSSAAVVALDFSELLTAEQLRCAFLEYRFESDGQTISDGVLLFAPPKHFTFPVPQFVTEVQEEADHFTIKLGTDSLAKYVEVELNGLDGHLDDNYFDLAPGRTKILILAKSSLSEQLTLEQLKKAITVRSAVDITDV
ncbi:glycoside hydrolase family 2 [Paenibacillus sp. CAA11]|uniref:beta-mannosidase n=1 Tax=Paenibacillus sp. CAA11 TaxID=1532905 RepID=UPI000D34D23F|nr:glycoside hydrolase family 2 protein [Paenibacillus sp. CAA11]AWB45455.1 glycoside hydrolase family 2 [Paenibacillus sp. CAA11]